MAHYQLGLALQEKGNSNQAENEWREAVRLRPTFSQAWQTLGASATRRGDWRALEPIGDQLKRIAPRFAEGYLFHATRALIRRRLGSGSRLESTAADRSQRAIGYVKLGQLRLSQKRWNEAEAFFREGLSEDSNSLEPSKGLVSLHLQRGKRQLRYGLSRRR